MSFYTLNFPASILGNINTNNTQFRTRSSPSLALQVSAVLQTDHENENFPDSWKLSGSRAAPSRRHSPKSLLNQPNTIGIIGGVSAISTLIFLEKLVWWSLKDGNECVPFVVCNDPELSKEFGRKDLAIGFNGGRIFENLSCKGVFLERSGAGCIVIPCHVSHAWHNEIFEICNLPFLHVGDCVARELKEAKLKPLEAGSSVRIGLLAGDGSLIAGFYQEKLQKQGFEVVLPDEATMEHIVDPAIQALNRRDMEGARNLLRIAIHILLVRAVNTVILASDEMQGLLPYDDPLLNKCIDPMDALARAAIKWSKSAENAK